MSQSFQQQILSNYGLLTALQYVNGGNLVSYVDSSNDPDPLATGLTYASWQQIIPAVFTWKLQNVQYPAYLNPYDAVTSDSKGYVQLSTALYDHDAGQSIGMHVTTQYPHVMFSMRQHQHAARRIHDIVV